MNKIDAKKEVWKSRLLDTGKRNRLINFKETKRSNLNIINPNFNSLYQKIVIEEKILQFPYPQDSLFEDEEHNDEEHNDEEKKIKIIKGDIETDKTISEQQKTLKVLRARSKMAIEEMGVNALYLSFGFLNWSEKKESSYKLSSPIILVPVTLTNKSLTSPYFLNVHEDEIVVNPTLKYKLSNDFGFHLPDFDFLNENIITYLKNIEKEVKKSGWTVDLKVSLSLLSYLKINMYYDLENKSSDIKNNPFIKALCGNPKDLKEIPAEINNYNHDSVDKPIDIYQVVDADSSQQDAIYLSKKGVSFVLQGPPGTGKSQTITNIISEALADGKRVLFVSEKMAALDVVYKRLNQAGLSEFCLTLHSHKTNKKDIITSLGDSLKQNRTSFKKDTLYQLNTLKKERDKLNNYVFQLHTQVQPLGMTIYEVNGLLSKLNSVPDLPFEFSNIESTTGEMFRDYTYLISVFSESMGKKSNDYDLNPWRGSSVSNISYDLRQNIDIHFSRLSSALPPFIKTLESNFDLFSLNRELKFDDIPEYVDFLNFCSFNPDFPEEWMSHSISELNVMIEQATEFKVNFLDYSNTMKELDTFFNKGFFNINSEISLFLSRIYDQLFQIFNDKYGTEKDIFDNSDNLIKICTDLKKEVEFLMITGEKYSLKLGLSKPLTIGEIQSFFEFTDIFTQDIRISKRWFDFTLKDKKSFQSILDKTKDTCFNIANIISDISSEYKSDIFALPYDILFSKFNDEYKSSFKFLNRNYRNDKNKINSLKLNIEKKIEDKDILLLLNKLIELGKYRKWLNENDPLLNDLLGGYYNGENTDFSLIEKSICLCDKIKDYYDDKVPDNIINLLSSRENINLFSNESHSLNNIFESRNLENYVSILRKPITKNIELKSILDELSLILSLISEANVLINPVLLSSKQNHDYLFYKKSLNELSKIQDIEKTLQKKETYLQKTYLYLYNSFQTDWDNIIHLLQKSLTFKNYTINYNLDRKFQTSFFSRTFNSSQFEQFAHDIDSFYEFHLNDIMWINSLFDDDFNVSKLNMYALLDKIEGCLNNLTGLEEWIDFRISKEMCESKGLGSVVNVALNEKIDKHVLLNAFHKRFYSLWLDAILPSYPAVNGFRSRNHEETIKKFVELDKMQLEIARLRIKDKLISKLPDINKITSAKEEISILKRELSKQKKIIPLQRLFTKIPTLLPCLKPCLLMSPLSVSMFLQSDEYKFDMVIFDEASQICTENAIGSIIRSKQVIIAGDNKQLPPTNFFNVTSLGGDFDSDEDEDSEDDYVYDSILDEALTVLPSQQLKWHYRSKHEHLIAFSNSEIYDNSLITFPSSIEKAPGLGVEYIYVEDGIYDRGSKRNNPIEAKKVAELIFEHFQKQPGRSLGVITFSSAQQQAIEFAVHKMRSENQNFEPYFDEEKEDPFFIKNLENVQGDERDTIIFSIGYAKDSNGKIYMNFGPVSREGGYRRLNVAITRAKYNVKLVGSIRPTDISSETNSKGTKMLRSYIDFAINGPTILEYGLSSNIINLESPFEESVYDFLIAEGYKVETQIGCSGYRIDLAVKHPSLDGRYVIGIECDGATYHSSRTARERDRLRQNILEEIGWKIYRVWSTDWIKDQKSEGVKLKKAVDRAISEYSEPFFENRSDTQQFVLESSLSDTGDNSDAIFQQVEEKKKNESDLPIFCYYEEANINDISNSFHDFSTFCKVVQHVINIESPIHFDILCRRVAPLFGNKRVTVKIKSNVSEALKLIEGVTKTDDFIILTNNPIKPRIAHDGMVSRPISYVSSMELIQAMLFTLSNNAKFKKEELYQFIIDAYQFPQTSKVRSLLDDVYYLLINEKKIIETNKNIKINIE